jgi:mutator protein MutT
MSTRHPLHAAVFIVLQRENKIFIMRRANTGWADGMWTIPSGHIDKGQTAVEAAIIEAQEEAGVTILPEHLKFIHAHYVFDAYANYYFKATHWEGEPCLNEPALCSEIQWCDIDALPEDMIAHVTGMLRSTAEGLMFSDTPNDPNPSPKSA